MSQEIGSKKPEAAASFRLCRITDVHENTTKNGSLTALEKDQLKEKLQKNDAAYLLESREEVVVRLTQQGEKLLANKQFQRPAPFEKEADGIYRFKCSANQASNYFSSFGANAVILEPKRLRDRMRKMYEEAFLRYRQETEEENKKPARQGSLTRGESKELYLFGFFRERFIEVAWCDPLRHVAMQGGDAFQQIDNFRKTVVNRIFGHGSQFLIQASVITAVASVADVISACYNKLITFDDFLNPGHSVKLQKALILFFVKIVECTFSFVLRCVFPLNVHTS